MEKSCYTCKHEELGAYEVPCDSCGQYDKWEPKRMEKSIKEWLEELPDGIREKALRYHEESKWKASHANSLAEALGNGFDWYYTDEGFDYWEEIHDKAENGEPIVAEERDSCVSPFTDDAKTRKEYPVYSGFVKYFPDAIAEIAHVSWEGGQQHGHDELHWDRAKSSDEPDALMRHLIDYTNTGNKKELAKVAWRSLAMLQKVCEGKEW